MSYSLSLWDCRSGSATRGKCQYLTSWECDLKTYPVYWRCLSYIVWSQILNLGASSNITPKKLFFRMFRRMTKCSPHMFWGPWNLIWYDFPSAWGWGDNDLVFIFGWTYPLICKMTKNYSCDKVCVKKSALFIILEYRTKCI